MATTIQFKRGLEANRFGFTPNIGEGIYCTDSKKLYIGDGVTAGGIGIDASNLDGYTPEQLAEASYNAIINPLDSKHIINQRDAGIVTYSSFVCDRWQYSQMAAGGSTSGEAGVINVSNDEQALEVRGNVTGGSGTEYISAIHRINDVRTFSNETAILSFDVESDDNGQMIVYVQQNFGSGGSGAVVVHNDYIDVSTDKTRVSISMNFPSVIGKTIGDNSFVNILITKQSGASSFTGKAVNLSSDVRISNVKLGYNDIYVPVDEANELTKCMNYYQTSYPKGTKAGDISVVGCVRIKNGISSTGSIYGYQVLPVEMRTVPNITVYCPSTGNSNACDYITSASGAVTGDQQASYTSNGITAKSILVFTDNVTANKFGIQYHYELDAEL